jgi:ABC-type polysaccharide/polyol phosphate transport system ATPase subunit/TPR repeat protein
MNRDAMITIRNVSKTFTTRADAGNKSLLRRTEKVTRNVLSDVSFEIKKGEVCGIIGRNGSGKSTLLKIISKIMNPDAGAVEINGKIASILELGMGFHQDLSGRDNIFLKGSMYGFSKEQMEERFDRIVKYAELEDYIDLPVRVYSSGMSSRLAFAIMINVDADAIILDEVLSTGDLAFSKKSKAHFLNMKREGKTIVIVSHTMSTIREMCDCVVWIDNGTVREIGPPNTVCGHYETELAESFEVIKELAESGVPASQNMLGCMYRDGIKAKKNLDLAVYWFEEAVKRDDDEAKINLADMIVSDIVPGTRETAVELYMSAAQKGNRDARNKLSRLLTEEKNDIGREIREDFKKLLSHGNSQLFYNYAALLMKTAWGTEDRLEALKWYTKSAELGNADAMYQISIMHRDGNGPKRDDAEYLKWLRMAADNGHVQSQLMLGNIYRDGIKVENDEKESFRWYEAAARNNNLDAIYQVAMMYREGKGTEKNIEESRKWLKAYSEHTLFNQINILADSFSHMKNGVYDPDRGMKWYLVNSGHNSPESEYQSAMLILNGEELSAKEEAVFFLKSAAKKNHLISASQLLNLKVFDLIDDKTAKEALDCMENIAKGGNPLAANMVGHMYADGKIVGADGKKAVEYLSIASDGGVSASMQKLGDMYRNGTHVNQNAEEAVKWFKKGVLVGNVWSATSLVYMYGSGTASKEDLEFAVKGLENMCLKGKVMAMRMLGLFYRDGIGVAADGKKALMWLTKASDCGDAVSRHLAGEMYKDGIGINENASEALKWFKSAAEQENVHSILAIIQMKDAGKADDSSFKYAIERLEQLARGGNVFAIRNLGIMYLEGKSVTKNIEEARLWFEKAAVLGDAFSIDKLNNLD